MPVTLQALGLSSGTVELHALESGRAKNNDNLMAVLNASAQKSSHPRKHANYRAAIEYSKAIFGGSACA
ncbi:hypothetical protein KIN20_032659 [Parelaphostrongylus tenuis]|uniref:Uncharacterized protein n=1 Tax=Parelaphostrongylus tenuis TaxID=148309 RepID=A0AAD5R7G6_PARTN|nr:hypothetical protein KIN20_032659 [Parelaphostrongylus tenuis]